MIIYKFGGSVLQEKQRVFDIIKDGLEEHKKIIVVVSAIGRIFSPYSTDTLYSMCKYTSEKEKNRIVACGEIISSVLVSDMLNEKGVKAVALSLYEMNLVYDNNEFQMNDFLTSCLCEYDVVIIPGFIGLKNNEIILLPRGGSNITASFLASYYNAQLVIFTDVNGLYLKDPKQYCNLSKLDYVSYDEFIELTKENQKFFPVEGIKYLKSGNVKVLIRNLESEDGTIIN